MFRSLTTIAALLTLVPLAPAQERKPGDPVALLLTAPPAPIPSLKYRLLLDRRELVPGNAATLYYRALASLFENPALQSEIKENHWTDWVTMPIAELPVKEVRAKVYGARNLFREFELASRRRDCDWQLDFRDEGFALLLSELQGYRQITYVFAAKARLEIAEGRFADAVDTIRTGLALGRHLTEGPTLIHMLVGMAISRIMIGQLEVLVQVPDAPNLYWALTVLPHPFIDARTRSLDESEWLDQSLPFLKRLESGPMTLREVADVFGAIRKMHSDLGIVPPSLLQRLGYAYYIEAVQDGARASLIKQGLQRETVDAMPSVQVVFLSRYREFRVARDEFLKWMHVPEGRKHAACERASKRFEAARNDFESLVYGEPGRSPFDQLAELVTRRKTAHETILDRMDFLERPLAMMRCVEALRLHAASHGRWPAKLDDVKEVPVPVDPLTEKPFDYQVRDDNHAVLRTTADEKVPANVARVFQLTLRR